MTLYRLAQLVLVVFKSMVREDVEAADIPRLQLIRSERLHRELANTEGISPAIVIIELVIEELSE